MRKRDLVPGEMYAIASETIPGTHDDLRFYPLKKGELVSVDTHAHMRMADGRRVYISGGNHQDRETGLHRVTLARVVCRWQELAGACATAERAAFGDDTAGYARLQALRARHRALGLPGRLLVTHRGTLDLRMDYHDLARWIAQQDVRDHSYDVMPDGWGTRTYHADSWDDETLDALISGFELIAAAR